MSTTTSYIPEKYAVVGEVLKLRNDKGVWTNGWIVESTGDLADEPPDYRKAIRGHRGHTGDDWPKK